MPEPMTKKWLTSGADKDVNFVNGSIFSDDSVLSNLLDTTVCKGDVGLLDYECRPSAPRTFKLQAMTLRSTHWLLGNRLLESNDGNRQRSRE